MTPRERLLCVLQGQTPDRVPVSPFVQETYLSYYFKKTKTDRLLDAKILADELDFDLMSRIFRYATPEAMLKCAQNWDLSIDVSINRGICTRTTTIQTPVRVLRQVEAAPYVPAKIGGTVFSNVEYLIKDADDFEAFRKYMPKMSLEYRTEVLEYAKFSRNYIENRGITVPWTYGSVYNQASHFIDVQDMMVDALADEDYYQEYMRFFTDLCLEGVELYAQSEFDAMGFQGNIANGALMGPDYFRKQVMPFEQELLLAAKAAGKPTVYHNCGKAKNLYPCYADMGFTVWETISESPVGDNTLEQAKQYFADAHILCGNLDQVHFLKTASPEEVRQRTRQTVLTGKPGAHYIFACSDFLEENTPLENIRAMIAEAKAAGRYDGPSE